MFSAQTLFSILSVLSLSNPSTVEAKTISPLSYVTAARNHTCQLALPVTACRNETKVEDGCCASAASLTLYTQYWNTVSTGFGTANEVMEADNVGRSWAARQYTGRESQGSLLPKNNWGVHGLWADYCDGTYPGYCDLTRQFDPIPGPNYTQGWNPRETVEPFTGGDISTPTLQYFGKYDLLDWMNKRWVSNAGENYVFWQHEFAKHGTCFSTYDIACYGPTYEQGQEIVDYYQTVAGYDLRYPTFDWLSKAGIVPSNTTTYTLTQIEQALKDGSGTVPFIGCSGSDRTRLNEVWYFNHAIGRTQDLNYIPVDKIGNHSCNATQGLWYYERSEGSEQ